MSNEIRYIKVIPLCEREAERESEKLGLVLRENVFIDQRQPACAEMWARLGMVT